MKITDEKKAELEKPLKMAGEQNAGHTQRPWRVARSDSGCVYVVAEDGSGDICAVSSRLDGRDNAGKAREQEANAYVLAAAPALLAALKKLRGEIDWITSQSDQGRLEAIERLHKDYNSILHAADSAIAQAEGAAK